MESTQKLKSAVWKGLKMLKQQEKKTALYCRLSQEDKFGNNGGDSSSIQTQKVMLSQYANDNGFLNHTFYVDDGASGTTFEREDFQRMISDIEDGKGGLCNHKRP